MEGLSGRPTIIVGKREGPRLLACGSILGRAYYLGTGRERPEPLTGEAWDEVDEAPPPRIDPGLLPSFPFLRAEPDGGGGGDVIS